MISPRQVRSTAFPVLTCSDAGSSVSVGAQESVMLYTRRELGKLALAAVPVSPFLIRSALAAGKPNSKFAGVQVGLNVPYNFGNNWMSGDDTLARCVELGVSAVELRSQPVELFLGTPATPPPAGGGGGGRATPTPEQGAARKAAAEALRKWRSEEHTSELQSP